MKNPFRVHAALFLVNFIYGTNFTIAKELMPAYIQPFGFIFWRVIVSLVLYIAVHYYFIREKVAKQDLFKLFLCGIFGVAVNQLLFFKGLSITTPINASLIMITTPVLVLIIASIIIKETISLIKVTGIILGAGGAFIIIFFGHDFSFGSATFTGDLYIFLNAISYAVYLVMVKPLMQKYHPITVIKWVFSFGFLLVIPFGLQEGIGADWSGLSLSLWAAFFYVIIGTTFVAYLLNIMALRLVNPSLVGIYIYVQPVIATLMAVLLGKDELTVLKIIASVFIFGGVYLVSMPSFRKQNIS